MASCGEISCDQCNEERALLANTVLKMHRCCLYSQDNTGDFSEPCLLDNGETCIYNKPALGQCDEYDKCQCPACILARTILSD